MLKEPIYNGIVDGPLERTFAVLQETVPRAGLRVVSVDQTAKTIALEITVKLFDLILWRCWSDRVVLACRQRGDKTEVDVYGHPSWGRTGVRKGEKWYRMEELSVTFGRLIEEANRVSGSD